MDETQGVKRCVDKRRGDPRWTREGYERLMRDGFDVPECGMRFESSTDSEADDKDVEVEVEVIRENN